VFAPRTKQTGQKCCGMMANGLDMNKTSDRIFLVEDLVMGKISAMIVLRNLIKEQNYWILHPVARVSIKYRNSLRT
jgi:hypothetical protein